VFYAAIVYWNARRIFDESFIASSGLPFTPLARSLQSGAHPKQASTRFVMVSLLVNFLPPQKPTSAWKYALQQHFSMKSQDRAGAVVL